MASIRDRILDAIETALEAASAGGTTKPTGLAVHRFRTIPIEKDDLPAIVFYPDNDAGQVNVVSRTDRQMNVRFELRAIVPDGSYPDKAVDALYVWLMKALFADETFGGLAVQVIEGEMQWDEELADKRYAAATVSNAVEYYTDETDPESH